MILAAGRGERMKPLTDNCPKPLLMAGGKTLIEYHIEKLAAAGIKEVVINHAWLGEQIVNALGNGERWGINIHYSPEHNGALETAGGIKKALPLLQSEQGDTPFLVVNGDIFIDYNFTDIPSLKDNQLGHLWLVQNPKHNPDGDFGITEGILSNNDGSRYTFSGVALYRPTLFAPLKDNNIEKLAPLLRQGADRLAISASIMPGRWIDVGTPERLSDLNQQLLGNDT
jgi:N-acetyl-alpha-D-muramate 1-phosphate uridylyltransferase